MSDNIRVVNSGQKIALFFVSALLLFISRPNAQELIVVMDLATKNNISRTIVDSVCDKICNEIARNRQYTPFDRQFLSVTLEQAGAQQLGACLDTRCLSEAGKLLGAKYSIGGSLFLSKGILEVTLNRVDCESGKSVQTVQCESQGTINFFLNEKLPSLVQDLMTDGAPVATTTVSKKSSRHPLAWIGMSALAVAGGGAAVYLLNKKNQTATNADLPIDDVPVHVP